MSAATYSGTAFPVRAVSIAWAPALAAVKHVPVMDVGQGSEAEFAKAGDVSGKLLLVHTKVLAKWADLFWEYEQAPAVIALAVKGKAKAIAFMATRDNDILYRHTNSGAGEIDRLPMVIVAREDGERIARLLASANPVWADLAIPNRIGGPIKSWNVAVLPVAARCHANCRMSSASVSPPVLSLARVNGHSNPAFSTMPAMISAHAGKLALLREGFGGAKAAPYYPFHFVFWGGTGTDRLAQVRRRSPQ